MADERDPPLRGDRVRGGLGHVVQQRREARSASRAGELVGERLGQHRAHAAGARRGRPAPGRPPASTVVLDHLEGVPQHVLVVVRRSGRGPRARLELGHQRPEHRRARPSARTPGRAGQARRCGPARPPGARPARPRSGAASRARRGRGRGLDREPELLGDARRRAAAAPGRRRSAAGPTSRRRRAAHVAEAAVRVDHRARGVQAATAIALTVRSRRDRSSSMVPPWSGVMSTCAARAPPCTRHAPNARDRRKRRRAVRPRRAPRRRPRRRRRSPRPGRSRGGPSARRAPRRPPPRPARPSGASGATRAAQVAAGSPLVDPRDARPHGAGHLVVDRPAPAPRAPRRVIRSPPWAPEQHDLVPHAPRPPPGRGRP